MIVKSGDARIKHTLPPLVFKFLNLIYKIDEELSSINWGDF